MRVSREALIEVKRIGPDPRDPRKLAVDLVVDGEPHIRLMQGDTLTVSAELPDGMFRRAWNWLKAT